MRSSSLSRWCKWTERGIAVALCVLGTGCADQLMGPMDSSAPSFTHIPGHEITFVGAASGANPTGGSVTIVRPVGAQAGDVLVAFLAANSPSGESFDTPAGWQVASTGAAEYQSMVFWRLVGNSEPASYTFTHTNSFSSLAGHVLAYRGVDPTNPIHAEGAAHDLSAPSLTTTVAGTMLVAGWATIGSGVTPIPPASMTPRGNAAVPSGPGIGAVADLVADEPFAGPGATGPRTATAPFSSGSRKAQMIALAPEPSPALPTTKAECYNGGWASFGVFKNQGSCVSFVSSGGKKPPK